MLDNKKNITNIRKKIKGYWKDDRKYSTTMLMAFLVSFAMCFTFLFFGPFEITVSNTASIAFTPSEMIWYMSLLTLSLSLILTCTLAFFRGKLFNYAVTSIFSFTLCGYIQGNFLNNHVAELTGETIAWNLEAKEMIFNFMIWLFIFIVSFTVLSWNKQKWSRMVQFISIIIVAMQGVAFISLSFGGAFDIEKDREYIVSQSEMFTYSKETNTVVYVLDMFDYKYIEEVLADDPAFFDKMDGFTSYTNAISEHRRTRPGLNDILTNAPNAYDIPFPIFAEQSWKQVDTNILEDLNNADVKVNIYAEMEYMFGDTPPIDMVSNIIPEKGTINANKVAKNLIDLSLYRYMPLIAKPFFWSYSGDINEGCFVSEGIPVYEIDETIYKAGLDTIQLTEDHYFKFYHFNGSHVPFTLTENGERSETPTSLVAQTKGSFNIIFKAFEEMKRLGIYEDMNIIIIADHGILDTLAKPLESEVRIGLFHKPKGSANTPLKYSKAPVSHENIPATIMKSLNLPYEEYGRPLDEIGEEEEIVRYSYCQIHYYDDLEDCQWNEHKNDRLYTYEINGDAADFNNWKVIEDQELKHRY